MEVETYLLREQDPNILPYYCLFHRDEALPSLSRLLTQQSDHIYLSKTETFKVGNGSSRIHVLAVRREPHFLNAYGNEARPKDIVLNPVTRS